MSWAVVAVLVAVGTALAYTRGSAFGNGAAVPPPEHDGLQQVAQTHALPGFDDLLAYATSAAAQPAGSTAGTPGASGGQGAASGLAESGIPETALLAYREAAQRDAALRPDCHIPWEMLAAIGRVESNHGRFDNATLYADGLSDPPVIGIPLNGNGTALILDTDNGRVDGDTVYDRAVGPMQFIPSTWATWGVDANDDGVADPFNIFDAAAAAGDYLCAAGGDLATGAGQTRAILAYNHSSEYLSLVLQVESIYSNGAQSYPTPARPPKPPTDVPPVNPGPPASPPPVLPPTSGSSSPTTSPTSSPQSPTPTPPSSTPPASTDSSTTPPDCVSTSTTPPDTSTDSPSSSDTTGCGSSTDPPTSTDPPATTSADSPSDTTSANPPDSSTDASST